jgi:hypothetical protein
MNTPTRLKKADVEQLIAYFNNTTEFPPDDPIAMARLAVSFDRFAAAVAAGNVDEGKAAELAATFVLFGNQWLQSHPEVQLAKQRLWTFERVKQAIAYFNDTTAVPADDAAGLQRLVTEYDTFIADVRAGWVEDGDAKGLAEAFEKIANAWFAKNANFKRAPAPAVRAR